MAEIFFPDFVGEWDYGMVFMVSGLNDQLRNLYERFCTGEDINYWYGWDLVDLGEDEYLVTLSVSWEDGRTVLIGLTAEMWDLIPHLIEKQDLALFTDWSQDCLSCSSCGVEEEQELLPHALFIRQAHRGLDDLAISVMHALEKKPQDARLQRLQNILISGVVPGTLH